VLDIWLLAFLWLGISGWGKKNLTFDAARQRREPFVWRHHLAQIHSFPTRDLHFSMEKLSLRRVEGAVLCFL